MFVSFCIAIYSLITIILYRKYRKESYDIAKTKEANGSSKVVDTGENKHSMYHWFLVPTIIACINYPCTANQDGVQMTEVAYVEDEDMAGLCVN